MKVQLRPSESRATVGNKFCLQMDLFLNPPTGIPMIPRRASFDPRERYAKMLVTSNLLRIARRLIADSRGVNSGVKSRNEITFYYFHTYYSALLSSIKLKGMILLL